MSDAAQARRALALLDLTDLTDNATEVGVLQLCAKAQDKHGVCAAVCLWPQFVKLARQQLGRSGVRIATVVNFPAGGTNISRVIGDIAEALDDGADEIDLVLPWKAFLSGDASMASDMVSEARAACGASVLKVILESGAYPDQASVTAASAIAIAAGADFIKTSTGKTPVGATPQAAESMLGAIKASGRPVGFKASGGIRTLPEANAYLALADRIMGPDWAKPATFRFGASSLHAALIAALDGAEPGDRADGAY